MSSMTDQGDNKDALLEKLDGLMQSGRARKRRDPPPVLTDAIPTGSEGDIPTLTDAVEVPETSLTEQRAEQPQEQVQHPLIDASGDLEIPLEFEPAIRVDSAPADSDKDVPDGSGTTIERDKPLNFEPTPPIGLDEDVTAGQSAAVDDRQEAPHDLQSESAADLRHSISSRLVSVIDREMTALTEEIPGHKSKLEVLQRSLRFALPELVRLRLQEDPAGDSSVDKDDSADAES